MQDLGKMVGAVPGENIYERVADLIDRPTCRIGYVPGSADRSCSACGETFCADGDGVNHPIDWAFCPNCGARVA